MHRLNRLIKILRLPILVIGIFLSFLSVAEEEPDLEELPKNHLVYVEPTNIIKADKIAESYLVPYRERRPKWGVTGSVGVNSYQPVNYDPNFSAFDYHSVYRGPTLPLIEVQTVVKRNFSTGSLGVEAAVGQYENGSTRPNASATTLSLTPWRVGAIFSFDTLGREPYVVPYFSAGVYSMIYKESLAGNSLNGSSQVAPYFNGGFAFSMDWIDRHAARLSYEDSGIQSSFLYLEGRTYIKSSNRRDHDFSSPISLGGGVRVEF